jgi:hypothetical protein
MRTKIMLWILIIIMLTASTPSTQPAHYNACPPFDYDCACPSKYCLFTQLYIPQVVNSGYQK